MAEDSVKYPALTVFQRYRSALQKATYYPLSLASLLIEQGVLPPEVLRQVDERPSEERVVTLFTHMCASLACAAKEEVAQERLHKCLWAIGRLFPECVELIISLKLAFYEELQQSVTDTRTHLQKERNFPSFSTTRSSENGHTAEESTSQQTTSKHEEVKCTEQGKFEKDRPKALQPLDRVEISSAEQQQANANLGQKVPKIEVSEENKVIKGTPSAVEHNGHLEDQLLEDTAREHNLEDDSVTQKTEQ